MNLLPNNGAVAMQPDTWKAWALFLGGAVFGHAGWDAPIIAAGALALGFVVGVQSSASDAPEQTDEN